MEKIIKLNEQTAGRDRLVRLLQYGSRTYWYYAQNIGVTQHSAEVIRSLEYTLSSFRKLLRLGRCLDSIHAGLKIMKHPDTVLRVILVASKIANALFLFTDHIIWIGRVGLHKVNIEKWTKTSNKCWLLSIIMNLIRDIHEIVKILGHEGKNAFLNTSKISLNTWKQYEMFIPIRNHKEVVMDTVKNGCDLLIPLTALGYTKLTPGTIGLCGVISSLVGLYTIVYPLYKLTPS
ncbi:peroxisomal biogenesis factor 11ab [Megalopta genalis]|uniref:peroxisomal biogenesis factor 11ab n=1 Tax=Megalopta genalis TaxID=115081 RepID=UPI003FD0DD80